MESTKKVNNGPWTPEEQAAWVQAQEQLRKERANQKPIAYRKYICTLRGCSPECRAYNHC